MRGWELRFRVEGLGSRVQGLGVWGLRFSGWCSGFGVWGLGFRVWGLGFRVWGLGWGLHLRPVGHLFAARVEVRYAVVAPVPTRSFKRN